MKDTIAIGECSDHKVCKHFKSQIEFFFFKQRGINKARKNCLSGSGMDDQGWPSGMEGQRMFYSQEDV